MRPSPDSSRRPTGRRRFVRGLVPVLVAALVPLCAVFAAPTAGAAPAVPDPGAAEAEFVGHINALRASRGLGALSVDAELTREARSWAATMAGQGRIFHTSNLSNGITANWVKLGENVGVGADVGVLFQAFVDSPTHYANLVDPKYTSVGIGVVVSGDRIFTAHRFMAVAPAAPPPPPPVEAPVVTAPPATVPPTTVPPTTVAPTTVPTTTTEAPVTPTRAAGSSPPKLGPIHRISGLLRDPA